MEIMQKEMYVVRRKGTDEYTRNNGYIRSLSEDEGKSAIRLYETIHLAKASVRRIPRFEESYEFVPVRVTIETMGE